MKVHCAVLGFQVDPEIICRTKSGKHPECRKCEKRMIKKPEWLACKRKPRKRCSCDRIFFPTSNRQKFCERCWKWNENEKSRIRMAKFRKRAKEMSAVTV